MSLAERQNAHHPLALLTGRALSCVWKRSVEPLKIKCKSKSINNVTTCMCLKNRKLITKRKASNTEACNYFHTKSSNSLQFSKLFLPTTQIIGIDHT